LTENNGADRAELDFANWFKEIATIANTEISVAERKTWFKAEADGFIEDILQEKSNRRAEGKTAVVILPTPKLVPTTPGIHTESMSIVEHTTYVGQIESSDGNNGALTHTLISSDAPSLMISESGKVEFTIAPDYEVNDTYSFTVSASADDFVATKKIDIFVENFALSDGKAALLAIGYNSPKIDQQHEFVTGIDFPSDIEPRYKEVMNNLNGVLGGYPNYAFFSVNANGTDSDAKPVVNRLIEINWLDPEDNSLAGILAKTSCLSRSNTGDGCTSSTNQINTCVGILSDITNPFGSEEAQEIRHTKWFLGLAHEYFHVYQRAHALDRGLDYQTDRDNPETTVQAPRWWIEGAAVLFQNAWFEQNWNSLSDFSGLSWNNVAVSIQEFSSASLLKEVRRGILDSPGYNQTGCDPGWTMSYIEEDADTSSRCKGKYMATTYLAHITSYKTIWIDIPQDYYDLGFRGAFEKHVGMTNQEFYDSYNEFLRSGNPEDEPPIGWGTPDKPISEYADFLSITPET